MRLVTVQGGSRDGTLAVANRALDRCVPWPAGFATLQAALDDWAEAEPRLREVDATLHADAAAGRPLDPAELLAPLPRAYQWIDGSTFLTHMERLRVARDAAMPPGYRTDPIAYQAGSDHFVAPGEIVVLGDERWGLDLEATVVVVTDDLPVGATVDEVGEHVKLVGLANDLTHRNVLPLEAAKGVGFWHTKPPRPLAPALVTPDDLGDLWRDGLLHATVRCWVNDIEIGALDSAADCSFDFHVLLAYLVGSRSLAAGTLVGSGTVSNRDPERGVGAIAERRALQTLAGEEPMPYLADGDTVAIEAFDGAGVSLFGPMRHRIVTRSTAATPSANRSRA
jgi:fumarylacetoacetate (FAA) hydrolase